MADISTKYMGLNLKSPIIASSSDFTSNVENIVKLEKAGCGAVVLKSIFEEQILMEIDSFGMNNMFNSYSDAENYIGYYTKKNEVNKYLKLITDSKKQVEIPVISSVHCSTNGEWINYVQEIEKAGADAIELNVFILPSDINSTAQDIEKIYFSILDEVKQKTKLPVALKMHHYFTNLANLLVQFSKKVDSLVLFNRFFNPDIDIEKETIKSAGSYSLTEDNYLIQRWLGIIRPHVTCDLSASGGIHDSNAVIKSLLAGANVAQIATAFYQQGIDVAGKMNKELSDWMDKKNYGKIDDFRGKLSYTKIPNPNLYERAQFMKYFSDFSK